MSKGLILVTRIRIEKIKDLGSEWEDKWGEGDDHQKALRENKSLLCVSEKGEKEYKIEAEILAMSSIHYPLIVIKGDWFGINRMNEIFGILCKIISKKNKDVKYIIGIHYGGGGVTTQEIRAGIGSSDLVEEGKNTLKELVHPYSFGRSIEELAEFIRTNRQNFQAKIQEAIEFLEKKTKEESKQELIRNFSLLKHRIAHLFLPMDIDLQGIEEVKNQEVTHQEQDGTSIKYLAKVLKEKRGGPEVNGSLCHYRRKLADLSWMVAKFKEKSSKFENDNPCIKDRQYLVPPSSELETQITESILELVDKDADKRTPGQREKIEKLKMLLLELIGLEPNTSSLKSQSSSPIFQFMCLLDCGIKEQRYDNVEQILAYFSKGWEVPGANPNPLKSFHDWFCAIHDCLDRLRKENSS